ncbi:MAG: Uncharacterised protein [Cryomorphaceae bacterium]|nr:MAG: Uncharacterised protein [Cryomorphaceae bacterium]
MKNFTQKLMSLLALVFTMSFTVDAQQEYDITPPVLTGITVSPEVVDVSDSSQIVTVTFTGSDDLSGIQSVNGAFSGPTTGGLWIYTSPDTLENGEVVYTGEIEVPHASSYATAIEPGDWTFNFCNALDNANNSSSWTSNDLQVSFEVTYNTFVLGCMDTSACNYDEASNVDDESCTYAIEGYDCDGGYIVTACNYYHMESGYSGNLFGAVVSLNETLASGDTITLSQGEQTHSFVVTSPAYPNYGTAAECFNEDLEPMMAYIFVDGNFSDSFGESLNSGATFTVSPNMDVLGCMDTSACNYDEASNVDDESCTYAIEGYDCDGSCINDSDGVCDELEVVGCTVESANNFTPDATDNDGSCIYSQEYVNNVICDVNIQNMYLNMPEGWSMFGYTCIEALNAQEALIDISDKIDIAKDFLGNAYLPEWNFNAIGELQYGEGYQIKLTETINNFQFCPVITE